MYLVVGLGNPGMKYAATRHNIGFEVVERFAYEHNIKLNKKKYHAKYGTGNINGEKVMVVQPQTYMNRSGESVLLFADFFKISMDNILVIYDDTSLDLGKIRIRKKGSAGGHNGIKNIIAHLNAQDFPRIKVGVGEKPPGWDLADYVLGRFSKEEMDIIIPAIKRASDSIETYIKDGVDAMMNLYNNK
ncbi:PTH1 family peptidyl-tRNA hydrolase [Natranaerovirga hydrolytica]|uniref:Peptidyl-tRNA hydrolase n=1 Tax=Natranaerovirga hydrolytica TaxID=680378 RepID=A0A4R1M6K3_9FIRM|nr:aminoacyl-tRNA hydrolase [Natranaerovirga hydrolytica]TCK87868.1 PTH1 family peptidyl-tRNA hydrolase [Natranaerovirga hydrolytica]